MTTVGTHHRPIFQLHQIPENIKKDQKQVVTAIVKQQLNIWLTLKIHPSHIEIKDELSTQPSPFHYNSPKWVSWYTP